MPTRVRRYSPPVDVVAWAAKAGVNVSDAGQCVVWLVLNKPVGVSGFAHVGEKEPCAKAQIDGVRRETRQWGDACVKPIGLKVYGRDWHSKL